MDQASEESFNPWERAWDGTKKAFVAAKEEEVKQAVEAVRPPWEWKASEFGPPKKTRESSGKVTDGKFEEVFSKLIKAESGGVHAKDGQLTPSGVGAEGITQLMRKTAQNPGYGVTPVKDKSEAEYLRFGRDYLKAMLNEFGGDYRKALAAYNAGPGNVKEAVAKGGQNWEKHLPKKSETLPYIQKILGE